MKGGAIVDRSRRTPVIAGNWKMNLGPAACRALLEELLAELPADPGCEVLVCPPYLDLPLAAELLAGSPVALGAQNCHWENAGAYTGEIAPAMLREAGCRAVIVGHSERRQYFGETDETAGRRLAAAVAEGLTGILCVGESLADREAGEELAVCARQLAGGLSGIDAAGLSRVILAYEPVWAIGTGRTATAEEAGRVCRALRQMAAERYGEEAAAGLRILYGGSMNEKNARELLAQPDIDGGLIGGAALVAGRFCGIIAACGEGDAL